MVLMWFMALVYANALLEVGVFLNNNNNKKKGNEC